MDIIDDQHAIEPPHVRPEELAARRLQGNTYLTLKTISCACENRVLVLRGCVPTYYLKQLAQEVVGHLEDVDRIDNQIEVVTIHGQWRRA